MLISTGKWPEGTERTNWAAGNQRGEDSRSLNALDSSLKSLLASRQSHFPREGAHGVSLPPPGPLLLLFPVDPVSPEASSQGAGTAQAGDGGQSGTPR